MELWKPNKTTRNSYLNQGHRCLDGYFQIPFQIVMDWITFKLLFLIGQELTDEYEQADSFVSPCYCY